MQGEAKANCNGDSPDAELVCQTCARQNAVPPCSDTANPRLRLGLHLRAGPFARLTIHNWNLPANTFNLRWQSGQEGQPERLLQRRDPR
mmetsp:Transcript_135072/g.328278  ORF Transcript_135072/g.328278 Transcript_135072/m.328278 type:complete len:89 (-) Transcript_135072:612-878(-)